jgi:hypothetical protein
LDIAIVAVLLGCAISDTAAATNQTSRDGLVAASARALPDRAGGELREAVGGLPGDVLIVFLAIVGLAARRRWSAASPGHGVTFFGMFDQLGGAVAGLKGCCGCHLHHDRGTPRRRQGGG